MLFVTLLSVISARVFSPYYDAGEAFDPVPAMKAGVKTFSLAFGNVNCQTLKPVIGQNIAFESQLDTVRKIRAAGGDVILSFGGASQDIAKEPAACVKDPATLVRVYQQFIDAYKLRGMDFDIEGNIENDSAANDRRAVAINTLRKANPQLQITFTLPVTSTGLAPNGLAILKSAQNHGTVIDKVNLMTMDFESNIVKMGDATISAAKGTLDQMKSMSFNAKLGLTPMIGLNDVKTQFFTLDDAKQVMQFVRQTPKIDHLGFWNIQTAQALDYVSVFNDFVRII